MDQDPAPGHTTENRKVGKATGLGLGLEWTQLQLVWPQQAQEVQEGGSLGVRRLGPKF